MAYGCGCFPGARDVPLGSSLEGPPRQWDAILPRPRAPRSLLCLTAVAGGAVVSHGVIENWAAFPRSVRTRLRERPPGRRGPPQRQMSIPRTVLDRGTIAVGTGQRDAGGGGRACHGEHLRSLQARGGSSPAPVAARRRCAPRRQGRETGVQSAMQLPSGSASGWFSRTFLTGGVQATGTGV